MIGSDDVRRLNFSLKIPQKLDEKNFHIWRQQKQTRARARQLRVELRAITLDSMSIQDNLLKIRTIIDALASIGDPLPVSHHIDVILEVAHELRLTKLKKVSVPDVASLNLTHYVPDVAASGDSNVVVSSDSSAPSAPQSVEPEYSSFRGAFNQHFQAPNVGSNQQFQAPNVGSNQQFQAPNVGGNYSNSTP
ncbi:hypothetical protein KIW84_022055 [Lathyrus oleraceus]|uniref:Uncharacterized protein n=1 Tax=Pisum sativum TaxID=3888 RepID=A0A9D4YA73_PEA|nr:hypothetical protein KIW84_022055 [Pisum sativum]